MKKRLSLIWFAGSVFGLPCILNPEKLECCVVILVSMIASFLVCKKHNPDIINIK